MVRQDSWILRFFQKSAFPEAKKSDLLKKLQDKHSFIENVEVELCFHVEITSELSEAELNIFQWILKSPLQPQSLLNSTSLKEGNGNLLVEICHRFNFSTSNSTNAVSICQNLGLKQVIRSETSRRYWIKSHSTHGFSKIQEQEIISMIHDRMNECRYTEENIPKKSFNEKLLKREKIYNVDVLKLKAKKLFKI
ncbi:hypothetical protein WA026_019396 [Henosepilachna vigintioctopunctata]|uniref:Phosphoribosylformylglycinamidine synthase N-terminal domain-containing protein n=1 Tax=Henosepilachna vigintioctopunctata TaxID=420089 RepID=A0AAW1UAI5_9CUCU